MLNVRIASIGTYHPEGVVTNLEVANHFYDFGTEDHKGIMDYMEYVGRDKRFVDTKHEGVISMAVKAAKKALDNANLNSFEMDAVIFVSDNPEYTTPANSLFIHKALGCRTDTAVNDINASCVGMINAIYMMAASMEVNKRLGKVLIVGAQNWYHFTESTLLKPIFGDSAACVILETTDSPKSYILDTNTYTNSDLCMRYVFPSVGISNLKEAPKLDKMMDTHINSFDQAPVQITTLLDDKGYSPSDVKLYCMSQYLHPEIIKLAVKLKQDIRKFPYVGNVHGYTGVTSPILALEYGLNHKLINRGDLMVMWSVGTGMTSTSLLLRY